MAVPRYRVKKIYQYTETVEVEAADKPAACDAAALIDGERNEDDCLYNCVVEEIPSDV